MSEDELKRLREKIENERDERIRDAFTQATRARTDLAEIKGQVTSVQTHAHDIDRKATAIGHALDEVRALVQAKHDEQEATLRDIGVQITKLQPANKFFSDIQDRWMGLLIIGLAAAALAALVGLK